ncbi:MAG: IS1182 family transposase [Elusimicrobiota bacterium]
MFRPYRQDQSYLLPPSLGDFLDETHPAHAINDIIEKIDLSTLMSRYGKMGQPAYHPRMMVKVILYGFTVGVFSSRRLQRACQENLAFKYLAGMETPAFKTFIEFRKRHRDDMKAVFVETVKLARELGLARLGAVALDGCKMAADTSKHKAMSYGRMREEEGRLREEMAGLLKQADEADAREDDEDGPDDDGYGLKKELARRESRLKKIEAAKAALEEREKKSNPGKPIDPKKQISFADHDARCHAKKGSGARYVHNSQAAVDMESQIIVENHIEDTVQDANAAKETLENMKGDLGETPDDLVADAAYGNQHTVDSCRDHGVTPVCAVSREGKEGKAGAAIDEFSYDGERNDFTCPHGAVFEFSHECPNGEQVMYGSREPLSCGCAHYMVKDGRGRLKVHKGHFAKRELKLIMEGKKELYRRRKCTVEPVFGQIQVGMGFRRYFYRGRSNVRSEWNLVCAAFNVKKITALLRAGKACLGRDSMRANDRYLLRPDAVGNGRTVGWRKSLFDSFWRKFAKPERLYLELVAAINGEGAPLMQYA